MDAIPYQLADDIGRQLTAGGFSNVQVKYMPEAGLIGANFVLCAAEPVWRKTLVLAPHKASAEEFAAMFRQWQENMLGDIKGSNPGPNLRGAMNFHGEEAVKQALTA